MAVIIAVLDHPTGRRDNPETHRSNRRGREGHLIQAFAAQVHSPVSLLHLAQFPHPVAFELSYVRYVAFLIALKNYSKKHLITY